MMFTLMLLCCWPSADVLKKKRGKKKPLTKAFLLCKTMQSRSISIDTAKKLSASGEHERKVHMRCY